MTLFERDSEIGACIQAFRSAEAGNGSCIIVSGGAGFGKSALLETVTSEARERGITTVTFRGNYAEHTTHLNFTFHVLRSLMDEFIQIASSGDLRKLAAEIDAAYENCKATLEWSIENSKKIRGDIDSFIGRIVRLAPTPGILLAIDNLHWLDLPSLEWMVSITSRIHSWPMVIIASVCAGITGADGDILDEVIVGADRRLELKSLNNQSITRMLEGRVQAHADENLCSKIANLTGGNPLLMENLLQKIEEQGANLDLKQPESLAGVTIPFLAASLRVRLRRISPEALEIYRVIAVLGDSPTIHSVSELCGLDAFACADFCHAMEKLGIIRLENDRVAITQPLLANSVLRDSSPKSLRSVHSQAAALLKDLGVSPQQVARHLLMGGCTADAPWVLNSLRLAAEEALSLDDAVTASRYLRRALEAKLPDEARAELLVLLASLVARVDLDEAARLIGQSISLSDKTVAEKISDDLLILLRLGRYKHELEIIHTAAVATKQETAQTIIHLLTDPGTINVPDAITEYKQSPLPAILQFLKIAWAGSAGTEAMSLATRATIWDHRSAMQAIAQLAGAHVLSLAGDHQSALRQCDSVLAFAKSRNILPIVTLALLQRSSSAFRIGRTEDSLQDARQTLEIAKRCKFHAAMAPATAQLVNVLIDVGYLEQAQVALNEGSAALTGIGDKLSSELLYARGRLNLIVGDTEAAVADFLACGERLVCRGIFNPSVTLWRSHAAQGLDELGERVEAQRLMSEEVALAQKWGFPGTIGESLHLSATIAAPESKSSLLSEAVELLRGSQEKSYLANALYEYGCALSKNQPAVARKILRECYELAEEFGLTGLSANARQQISEIGGRPPRLRMRGVGGLTDSEKKVALLAAQGKKNREIAASLFVQQRTVEIHLTNTYRKLGINGRDELINVMHPQPRPETRASQA
ncbi:AAA family ATPase [Streptomyces sp. NPDC095817]|uniref:ATP-binding protein n=1 Tax=Streptomyces sp. NPDC095817 TaxID=3155082 RepID=UPI00332D9FD0